MNGEMSMEGRYSPIVKEEMYRMHKKGTSFADIGLKYGALPERVKAIVWQREILWNEVYPKLGETTLRLGLEREFMYAQIFPFAEYGVDLNSIADLE